jgi:hypothetical protein
VSPKTPQIPPTAPRRVKVLAFPQVQMLDVAGPIQVFTAANERAAQPRPYATRVVAPEGAQIRGTSGLAFATEPLPDPADPLDTLIVAGGQGAQRDASFGPQLGGGPRLNPGGKPIRGGGASGIKCLAIIARCSSSGVLPLWNAS